MLVSFISYLICPLTHLSELASITISVCVCGVCGVHVSADA